MLRKILVFLIFLSLPLLSLAQTPTAAEIKYKREIVAHGLNKNVRVRLTSGETITGRIAEIKNESFTLQLVDQAGQVSSQELTYAELSKVTKVGDAKAGSAIKRGFLYGAAFYAGMLVVAAVAIGIAAAASH